MRITKQQKTAHFVDFFEVIEASPRPKTAQELVIEVDDLIRESWKHLDDPENLSKIIIELAIKNSGLGNHLADVASLEDDAKAQLQYKTNKRILELTDEGKTATVAKAKAELEFFKDAQAYRQLKKASTMLKLKREDVDSVAIKGQSRLGIIKEDIRQG